ncbi:MAG: hypothetical protein H6825_02760 [Planctomycetes bacterium]|nr:hypothetical protein [Planctomycetota bacterium]
MIKSFASLACAACAFVPSVSAQWQAAFELQDASHLVALPVAHDPSEELIVATEDPPVVLVLDLASGVVKRTLTRPTWQPSGAGRPIALDREGHLFVVDVATTTITEFDRDDRFVRTFPVDLSCAGDPTGSGIRDLEVTRRGTLVALGGWVSGSINWLLEIDPETGETIHCCDIDAAVGSSFEGARLALDADDVAYVTEYAPDAGPKRVAVIDVPSCTLIELVATPAVDTNLVDVEVTPGGAMVVGDNHGGFTWLSDASRQQFCALGSCTGSYANHATFTVSHGMLYAGAAAGCGTGSPRIDVLPLECGASPVRSIEVPLPSIGAVRVRHH